MRWQRSFTAHPTIPRSGNPGPLDAARQRTGGQPFVEAAHRLLARRPVEPPRELVDRGSPRATVAAQEQVIRELETDQPACPNDNGTFQAGTGKTTLGPDGRRRPGPESGPDCVHFGRSVEAPEPVTISTSPTPPVMKRIRI
ncbi:hypothetical protein FPZ12_012330 [Amycolatopsis acidicola]|uniref:Uncharacterized protein n=1 Tax=Amycolatopsis acidicola TaxID=2596893 RepID=A0A5N0V8M5_9PSEU|nr:hypothetical protein [Amycolatopsis acidicola]KAA9162024.1 hypothetical protein FPZ12_012330 [Amycolatopsis acidicola]